MHYWNYHKGANMGTWGCDALMWALANGAIEFIGLALKM